jgi:hypothetical protein
MGGFGWNFWGFPIFAVVFIAAYFSWARWMARRDAARTASRRGDDRP